MSIRPAWVLLSVAVGAACGLACSGDEKPSSRDGAQSGTHESTVASGSSSGSSGTKKGSESTGAAGSKDHDEDTEARDAEVVSAPDSASDAAEAGPRTGPYVEPPDPVDAQNIPSEVPTVSLEVAASDIAILEADPYADVDVPATFRDASGTTYASVEVHYRGAYALQTLIQFRATQRNWKIKFPSTAKYRNRREWNFNYEPHVRQKLAYDLMHLAGVRLPSARHVVLTLNGKIQGTYLEYEDPDNKDFLEETFGDKSGDLYKAAQDAPGLPRYFATLESLGTTDESYYLHYDKKTNSDSINEKDFSRLRTFIEALNTVPDEELSMATPIRRIPVASSVMNFMAEAAPL